MATAIATKQFVGAPRDGILLTPDILNKDADPGQEAKPDCWMQILSKARAMHQVCSNRKQARLRTALLRRQRKDGRTNAESSRGAACQATSLANSSKVRTAIAAPVDGSEEF